MRIETRSILAIVAAALVLSCSAARAQVPAASKVDILIWDDSAATPRLRPIDPADPAEVAAQQVMERVIGRSAPIQRLLSEIDTRMASFHSAPGRWLMSENGRVSIAMNMKESVMNGQAYATVRNMDLPGGTGTVFQAFVNKAMGSILGASADQMSQIELRVEEVTTHELDHIADCWAESDFVARYNDKDLTFWWQTNAKSSGTHFFNTVSDAKMAMNEGMAEAQQLYNFKAASYLYGDRAQAFFKADMWSTYRAKIPIEKRIMVRLAELSRALPGNMGVRASQYITQRYGLDSLQDPAIDVPAGTAGAVPTMKPLESMLSTEGVVALILTDLYDAGLATPEVIHDIHAEIGQTGLQATVDKLKEKLNDPTYSAKIDAIRSQRLMGADIDYARAKFLLESRLRGGMTAEDYNKALTRMIEQKLGGQYGHPGYVAVAELPDQEPLGGAVEVKPSERIRYLLRAAGSSELLRGQAKFFLSFLIAHYAINLINGGDKNPLTNIEDALKEMMSAQFIGSSVLFLGAAGGTDLALKSGAEAATKAGMENLGPRLAMIAAKNAKLGGPIGILVAGFLTRQVFAHDYSFLSCPNLSFGDKVIDVLKTLADFSTWDRRAVLELIGSTAGFVLVTAIAAGVGICTAGVGAVVVLAAAFVVSYLGGMVADWVSDLLDRWDYSGIKDTVRWAVSEYRATEMGNPLELLGKHIDGDDGQTIEGAKSLDERHTDLAVAMGRVGAQQVHRFACDPAHPEMYTAVTKGTFKEFYKLRDQWMSGSLNKMNDFVSQKQKDLDTAQNELEKVSNPFADGIDMHKAAILFAYDQQGNRLSASEIADYVALLCISNPDLDKQVGNVKIDDSAAVDALHDRFQGEIQASLEGVSAADLLAQHDALVAKTQAEYKAAKEKYDAFYKDWLGEIRDKSGEYMSALKDKVNDELTDVASFQLDTIQPSNPDLVKFVDERCDGLRKLLAAYAAILEGQQEAGPALAADSGN